MTFARKCWTWFGILFAGWLLILGWCLFVYQPTPPVQTVTSYSEVDVSRLKGKRSRPGKLAPETVQKQEVNATRWLLNQWDYRDPFERIR